MRSLRIFALPAMALLAGLMLAPGDGLESGANPKGEGVAIGDWGDRQRKETKLLAQWEFLASTNK